MNPWEQFPERARVFRAGSGFEGAFVKPPNVGMVAAFLVSPGGGGGGPTGANGGGGGGSGRVAGFLIPALWWPSCVEVSVGFGGAPGVAGNGGAGGSITLRCWSTRQDFLVCAGGGGGNATGAAGSSTTFSSSQHFRRFAICLNDAGTAGETGTATNGSGDTSGINSGGGGGAGNGTGGNINNPSSFGGYASVIAAAQNSGLKSQSGYTIRHPGVFWTIAGAGGPSNNAGVGSDGGDGGLGCGGGGGGVGSGGNGSGGAGGDGFIEIYAW